MFIIPVGNRVDWKRPPVMTLLLILVNCFVFFFLQSGSDAKDERAAEYYFSSDLPKWELSRYPEYVEKNEEPGKAQAIRELTGQQDVRALIIMERDIKFMRELHAGHVVTPETPEFAAWTAERKKYESMRSFTTRYMYYPDERNPVNALTSAFMHGGFDHLFGNMVVLFLVGFLVESVIGKKLFSFAYLIAIFGSTLMYTLTAHDGIPSLGASGAIAGVMGLYTVIFGLRKIDFFYSLAFYFGYVRAPAIVLLPLWLGNELYQFLGKDTGVAYMAHFGGLLCGATIGVLYRGTQRERIESHHEAVEGKELDQEAFQRGMGHLGAMEFQKALAIFKTLQGKHPDDLNLARLVYRAAKSDPSSEDYHRAAQRLLGASGTDALPADQAHTMFHEYLGCAKPAPRLGHDLIVKLAKRFAASNHCEDADKLVVFLKRSAPQHGELPAVLLALGRGYYREQRRDKFEEIMRSLISQFPQSKEAEAAASMLRVG